MFQFIRADVDTRPVSGLLRSPPGVCVRWRTLGCSAISAGFRRDISGDTGVFGCMLRYA